MHFFSHHSSYRPPYYVFWLWLWSGCETKPRNYYYLFFFFGRKFCQVHGKVTTIATKPVDMKLRVSVARPELLRDVCSSFASLNKTCQLRFTQEGLEITSIMDSGNIHLCSTGLTKNRLFEEYQVESRYNDTIVMDVNAENLYRALSKLGTSVLENELTIRLRRQNQMAYLALNFEVYSTGSEPTSVSHRVPISLQRESANLPSLPDTNMNVFVRAPDPISSLVRVSDRYRNLGPTVTISANNTGKLQIATSDAINSVIVDTTWTSITVLQLLHGNDDVDSQQQEIEDDTMYSVTVSTKEWFNVLQMHSIAKTVSIGISNQEFLVVYCKLTADNDYTEESEDAYLVYVLNHHEV